MPRTFSHGRGREISGNILNSITSHPARSFIDLLQFVLQEFLWSWRLTQSADASLKLKAVFSAPVYRQDKKKRRKRKKDHESAINRILQVQR